MSKRRAFTVIFGLFLLLIVFTSLCQSLNPQTGRVYISQEPFEACHPSHVRIMSQTQFGYDLNWLPLEDYLLITERFHGFFSPKIVTSNAFDLTPTKFVNWSGHSPKLVAENQVALYHIKAETDEIRLVDPHKQINSINVFYKPTIIKLRSSGLSMWMEASTDGLNLAYDGGDKISLLDIMTSEKRDWIVDVIAQSVSWHPNTDTIVYSAVPASEWKTQPFQLHEASLDPPFKKSIINSPDCHFSPKWSPDGKNIAFISVDQKSGNHEIFTVDMTMSDKKPKNITNSDFSESWFMWDREGTHVLYPSGSSLFRLNIESQHKELWLDVSPYSISKPILSPTGDKIAFLASDFDHIYVGLVDTNGENLEFVGKIPKS